MISCNGWCIALLLVLWERRGRSLSHLPLLPRSHSNSIRRRCPNRRCQPGSTTTALPRNPRRAAPVGAPRRRRPYRPSSLDSLGGLIRAPRTSAARPRSSIAPSRASPLLDEQQHRQRKQRCLRCRLPKLPEGGSGVSGPRPRPRCPPPCLHLAPRQASGPLERARGPESAAAAAQPAALLDRSSDLLLLLLLLPENPHWLCRALRSRRWRSTCRA